MARKSTNKATEQKTEKKPQVDITQNTNADINANAQDEDKAKDIEVEDATIVGENKNTPQNELQNSEELENSEAEAKAKENVKLENGPGPDLAPESAPLPVDPYETAVSLFMAANAFKYFFAKFHVFQVLYSWFSLIYYGYLKLKFDKDWREVDEKVRDNNKLVFHGMSSELYHHLRLISDNQKRDVLLKILTTSVGNLDALKNNIFTIEVLFRK
jgi:hypothetical protein